MHRRAKPTAKEIEKVRARYEAKKKEYEAKSLDELKEIYNTHKMSNTDRTALVHVADIKLKAQIAENAKALETKEAEENKNDNNSSEPTEGGKEAI